MAGKCSLIDAAWWSVAMRLEAILRRRPGAALDAGCGPRHLTELLRTRDVDSTGIDLVPAFIEHARTASPRQLRARRDGPAAGCRPLGDRHPGQVFADRPAARTTSTGCSPRSAGQRSRPGCSLPDSSTATSPPRSNTRSCRPGSGRLTSSRSLSGVRASSGSSAASAPHGTAAERTLRLPHSSSDARSRQTVTPIPTRRMLLWRWRSA